VLSSFLAINARASVRQEILEVAGPNSKDAKFVVFIVSLPAADENHPCTMTRSALQVGLEVFFLQRDSLRRQEFPWNSGNLRMRRAPPQDHAELVQDAGQRSAEGDQLEDLTLADELATAAV
jgi:hypothetical protein